MSDNAADWRFETKQVHSGAAPDPVTKARATPTFAFHDLSGTEIVRITGAVRDVGEFKLLAEFVASGAYKTRQFAEYKQLQSAKKGG